LNISVVIRTRDKERFLEKLLKTLSLQSILPSEIIIVNNFSSERKLKSLKGSLAKHTEQYRKSGREVKLALVSDQKFSHPYSTNLGINQAENEFVCVTNAHSLPISFSWLEDGLTHFKNEKVACVSGYFYPHQDTQCTRNLSIIAYRITEKYVLKMNWCSTMNCIIRKSLWKEYPFDENLPKVIPKTRIYGLEDYDWTLEMEARGLKTIVDPRFSIYHSHGSGLSEIRRNIQNFFIHKRLQRQIRKLKRPRESFCSIKGKNLRICNEIIS
jgi:GT2 family glycosyltransferase